MKSALSVISEQVKHFYLVRRLSLYEMKSSNNNNYLGMAWEVLNPLIQIAIYWFVFGYGIRQREPIEMTNGVEVAFLQWMLPGIIVWFFFYQSTIQGSKSIFSRLKMLSKMNFPMSVIPNIVIFSQFYIHLALMIFTFIVLQLSGYYFSIYYLQLIYYTFSAFVFIYALALITSTLSTIIRDVQMLLQATLRLLLYLSAILWPLTMLPENVMTIMKLNPVYYLVEGYRSSFLGTGWFFIEQWELTLLFWAVTIILFVTGSALHIRFRRHFIDFI